MTEDTRVGVRSWSIAIESLAAALLGYLVAGAVEFSLIRAYNPSERELA